MSLIYEQKVLKNISEKYHPNIVNQEEDGKFGKITLNAMASTRGL